MQISKRSDRVVFYSAAVSSFLETSVPLYTRELRVMFAANAELIEWLDRIWEPEESGHGNAMRDYLARTWPEYRWEDAYGAFLGEYRGYCGPALLRASPAREMLARCVTECQAAMLYRALSGYAADPDARELFAHMYADEVRHYKVFLRWFRHYREQERLGALEILGGMVRRRDKAQAEDAGTAIKYVNYGYSRALPFVPLEVASPAGRVLARLAGLAAVAIPPEPGRPG